MKPVISVIVAAYNEEKLLPICLRSLRQQNFKLPYEIIVVNNNSTDKTAFIAKSFKARVVNEKQKGVIFAKQKGLMAAKSEIIAVTDADTHPPSNWLATIYRLLDQPKVVVVVGPAKIYDGPLWHKKLLFWFFKLVHFWYKLTGGVLYCLGCNIAFKKAALLKHGGYDTRLSMGEDELGILSKLKQEGQVIFEPKMTNSISGRRAYLGVGHFLYEWVFHYCGNYFTGKIFKRAIFKPYDDIRD
jgi:glycosyltransferase involved in cell wall biosynthesis